MKLEISARAEFSKNVLVLEYFFGSIDFFAHKKFPGAALASWGFFMRGN
jgi:hypothetical protein